MLTDPDLLSIQEARDLVRRSAQAHAQYRSFDQMSVDRVCEAIALQLRHHVDRLGRLAVDETGFGDARSKARKTAFACEQVWQSIRGMQTVGVIKKDDQNRVYEIAEPYGVILAIVPVTNPTATALYKILIALKTRNSIVLSPHPRAVRCVGETARLAREAARREGAPADLITCMEKPTIEGTQEAMRQRQTALILSTGGPGLVRAAYSSGKPAIGVGPGNVPAYIEKSADVAHAVEAIVQSQVFDNSTLCCSEQSVVVDRAIDFAVREAFRARGAHFCGAEDKRKLERIVVTGRALNPAIVGLYPWQIAEMAGFAVPRECTVLLAEETGVGWEHPLSIEKLAPILAYYVSDDWKAGCERCMEILDFGGRGHTLIIHSNDSDIIWTFAREKPTHRILVNSPGSHGAVGLSTALRPSMTLGCGAFGGNITSDNISAEHLLLVKRVAWVKPGFVEAEAKERQRQGGRFASTSKAAAARVPKLASRSAYPRPPTRR